jgi:hypothetical protein
LITDGTLTAAEGDPLIAAANDLLVSISS